MRFVRKEKTEPKYFVPEVSQAIGLSEGTIHGFFKNSGRKKSTKDGLTLNEIVEVIEKPRTRGDGIDFNVVAEIRKRLTHEKGFVLDMSDENTEV